MHDIDSNVKGLRADDAKFYSLVISPSEAELAHIGNDEERLKEYTRKVMEQYAQNFQLKEGRRLGREDIVWGATVHQERSYRGTDPEVAAGNAKVGEKGPGLQTHVHVIVSARDTSQKISLNPAGRRNRFDLMKWQAGAGKQFEKQFGYTAQAHEKLRPRQRDTSRDAARAAKVGERVAGINGRVPKDQQLDPARVQQIAGGRHRVNALKSDHVPPRSQKALCYFENPKTKRFDELQICPQRLVSHPEILMRLPCGGRQYDKTFYRMLNRVEERSKSGQPIDNAYHLLATGKERPEPQRAASTIMQAVQQAVNSNTGRDKQTENIAEKKGRNSAELDIEM